ncbi:MAG: hypothetical protein OXG81_08240 [Acidobacteria bacterium]|nr:hypothetical protein [Acidobacteriota bacterium]
MKQRLRWSGFMAAIVVGAVLVWSPAQVQETTRPLLSSGNAPAPEERVFPPLRPEDDLDTELFETPGRNPGSAAHPMAPGRVRSDAPAWHELNHVEPPLPAWAGPLLHPRQADPEPPVDPRFHDPIRLSDDFRNDDYPFILSDPDNRDDVWMVWTSYSGRRDRLQLARRDPASGTWGPWNPVPGANGDVWRPSLGFDDDKRLWVVWAQPERLFEDQPNFDLYGRWFDGEHWGRLQRLTSAPGSDFNHRLARARDGSLHLVWQGIRDGQADILHMSYDGNSWSGERRISESPRNDWTPTLALDSEGAAWIAWDSYHNGDYDVFLRRLYRNRLGRVLTVAASPFFEARPSVAVDGEDRVWIAYELGEVGWGKDQGLLVDRERQPGSMLNRERTVAVRIVEGKEVTAAAPELRTLFPPRQRLHYTKTPNPSLSNPELALDDRGRLSLLVRAMESSGAYAQYWRLYVTTMEEGGWSAPAAVPWSIGRLSMSASATPSTEGGLWLGWARDNYPTFSAMLTLPEETVVENVYAARWEPTTAPGLKTETPQPPPFPQRHAGHEREDEDVARIRAWRTQVGGEDLQILRGDTHRHTELSPDLRGVPDGSVMDFYRYMTDVAAMDFGLISDHQYGGELEYWWWLEEKLADLFHTPQSYIALFGYERSINFPMGHRNVLHAERGHMPVPFFQKTGYVEYPNIRYHNGAGIVQDDDTKMLYEEVRNSGGITIPHTSATTMGTDWRDNDPEIEPLVEIFQGDRYSYEAPGAPLTDSGAQLQSELTRPHDEGFVSNAWEKGYRLGVIASSDHLSTHISYAMVFAKDRSRHAVLDAMRQRRTYGATDNIVLEFWMGEHFMGDEVTVAGEVPEMRIVAEGTKSFSTVEILRNGTSIYHNDPGGAEIDLRYIDLSPQPGPSYYYARLVQEDGQMAWSSPIWLEIE